MSDETQKAETVEAPKARELVNFVEETREITNKVQEHKCKVDQSIAYGGRLVVPDKDGKPVYFTFLACRQCFATEIVRE